MNVLITHVYSKENKGDAAILSAMIQQIKMHFKNTNIYASTYDDLSKENIWKEDAERIESFIYIISKYKNPIMQTLYASLIIVSSLLWAITYRLTKREYNFLVSTRTKNLLKHFASADLILPIGGGYLNRRDSLKETLLLILNLHPIAISKILNKPTMLYSQSLGPYDNPIQRFIAKLILNKVDLIIVRETISHKILLSMNIKKDIIKKSVDAGFLFKTNIKFDLKREVGMKKEDIKKRIVGITVRKWLNKNAQEFYENEMAKFCDAIIRKHDVNVIFIPQVTADYFKDDDRTIGQNIVNKMNVKKNVWNLNKNYNHNEIKALYSDLDYLIGTRFHSVIFSLTSQVPAIAIEYEHKTRGIMEDLNLAKWVIKIEEVNEERLTKLFEELIMDKKIYLETLNASLKKYLLIAKGTMELVKNTYNSMKTTK